jgi:hypothetical protein
MERVNQGYFRMFTAVCGESGDSLSSERMGEVQFVSFVLERGESWDSDAVGKHMTGSELGLIFASVKLAKRSWIDFRGFQEAIRKVAVSKGVTYQELEAVMTRSEAEALVEKAITAADLDESVIKAIQAVAAPLVAEGRHDYMRVRNAVEKIIGREMSREEKDAVKEMLREKDESMHGANDNDFEAANPLIVTPVIDAGGTGRGTKDGQKASQKGPSLFYRSGKVGRGSGKVGRGGGRGRGRGRGTRNISATNVIDEIHVERPTSDKDARVSLAVGWGDGLDSRKSHMLDSHMKDQSEIRAMPGMKPR